MRHQDCLQNHILESFVYANAAARTAASGFLAADIGRIAYQTDKGQYWRLISNSPVTWQLLTGATAGVNATQSLPANPTGTGATGGVMMGCAVTFTPLLTGTVRVTVSGSMANSAASSGAKPALRYGIGTPPPNASGPVGSSAGNAPQIANNANTAGLRAPFFLDAIVSGLTIGTTYWFDLILSAVTGGTANLYDLSFSVVELT